MRLNEATACSRDHGMFSGGSAGAAGGLPATLPPATARPATRQGLVPAECRTVAR